MIYDATVVGSGQGGNPLAYALADRGWKVALVEERYLGGTCVNTGCTPTKTMVASAQVAHYARVSARWGVRSGRVSVDLRRVIDRKAKIVREFRAGLRKKVAARPSLTLHRGHARFVEPHAVRVGRDVLESERIFIDTGTRPSVPDIAGLRSVGYLTNASIMEVRTLPKHLLVIGGGYIGLEFGQMFRRFGSEVTILHQGAEILAREDADTAAALRLALEAEGITFVLEGKTTAARRTKAGVELAVETKAGHRTVRGTDVLVATGRTPNTGDLGLDRAGIATDAHGYVTVNERLETNVPGVWALGDVKGGPQFTHVSYNDYQVIYANLVEGAPASIKDRLVPYSVFTDPQLGRVGMTEAEARATGRRLKIGTIPMSWVARAIERGETAGMMKLVVDADTDRILGGAMLCAEGGELIQAIRIAMLANLPYTKLKGEIYIHPTLTEGFFTLMDSVKPRA